MVFLPFYVRSFFLSFISSCLISKCTLSFS